MTTTLIASVLIFVLGAVMSVSVEPLATAIGRGAAVLRRRVDWQRHARGGRRRLLRRADELQRELEDRPPAAGDVSDSENRVLSSAEQRLRAGLRDAKDRLQKVTDARSRFGHIPDTAETRKALGNPPAKAGEGLERQLIERTRYRAIDEELRERGIDALMEDIVNRARGYGDDWSSADQLASELQPDPLDALRALDEELFLELDRERAEHDLRLAAAVPVVALTSYGAVVWTPWLAVLSALGVVVFIRSALARSIERSRVLNLISLRGLETEALRDASNRGRDDVRSFISIKKQAEARAAAKAATEAEGSTPSAKA